MRVASAPSRPTYSHRRYQLPPPPSQGYLTYDDGRTRPPNKPPGAARTCKPTQDNVAWRHGANSTAGPKHLGWWTTHPYLQDPINSSFDGRPSRTSLAAHMAASARAVRRFSRFRRGRQVRRCLLLLLLLHGVVSGSLVSLVRARLSAGAAANADGAWRMDAVSWATRWKLAGRECRAEVGALISSLPWFSVDEGGQDICDLVSPCPASASDCGRFVSFRRRRKSLAHSSCCSTTLFLQESSASYI